MAFDCQQIKGLLTYLVNVGLFLITLYHSSPCSSKCNSQLTMQTAKYPSTIHYSVSFCLTARCNMNTLFDLLFGPNRTLKEYSVQP